MPDIQYKITFAEPAAGEKSRTLNMRISGAGSVAPIVAGLQPRAIVHVTGEANAAGFAPSYCFGWLGKDDKTIYAGPHAGSGIDAVLFVRDAFEAQGEPDVYGRQPGVVQGWVYLAYLEPVKGHVVEVPE